MLAVGVHDAPHMNVSIFSEEAPNCSPFGGRTEMPLRQDSVLPHSSPFHRGRGEPIQVQASFRATELIQIRKLDKGGHHEPLIQANTV